MTDAFVAADDIILGALVVGLPLYNLLANRWPPFNKALFVPMNLTVTAVVLGLALGPMDLSPRAIHGSSTLGGLAAGLALGVFAAAPLFALALFERGARLVRDERVAHLRDGRLAYQVLVRIPLGTALLEEVAFRGVLFAAWRDSGAVSAAVFSSIVFGLWHIGPTINLVQANDPAASTPAVLRAIVGAVLFTTGAGLLFSWLRVELGLVAPFAMHAAVNGLATLASVFGARRLATLRSTR